MLRNKRLTLHVVLKTKLGRLRSEGAFKLGVCGRPHGFPRIVQLFSQRGETRSERERFRGHVCTHDGEFDFELRDAGLRRAASLEHHLRGEGSLVVGGALASKLRIGAIAHAPPTTLQLLLLTPRRIAVAIAAVGVRR